MASTSTSTSTSSLLRDLPPPERLTYSIHSSSGHTADFVPTNILVDSPTEKDSRWTGATALTSTSTSSDANGDDRKSITSASVKEREGGGRANKKDVQFVMLELEKPTLVRKIGFGKFMKTHSCNLAEFSVYGGMSPDKRYMHLLYHGGLQNNSEKELFDLVVAEPSTRSREPVLLPIKYIRIDAIAAHSLNYNVSIWHVWLEGSSTPSVMDPILRSFEHHRDLSTSHLLLAHLRRVHLLPAFSTLLSTLPSTTSSSFENPLLSSLHSSLVLKGSFIGPSGAEKLLEEALDKGLFREWNGEGTKGKSVARWERIDDEESMEDKPSPRGGHSMVKVGRKLLLHGGWDGSKDLDDLWEFDLPRSTSSGEVGGKWRCLDRGTASDSPSESGERRKRPRGRSCHQLAVDDSEGWVYLLGGHAPSEEALQNDYLSSLDPLLPPTTSSTSTSTNGNGGGGEPEIVPMEVEGSNVSTNGGSNGSSCSGRGLANDFWRYKAVGQGAGTWELLSRDVSLEKGPKLIFDHTMLVHSEAKLLYVFGGKIVELDKEEVTEGNVSGMYVYNIAKKEWHFLFGDPSPSDAFRSERLLSRQGHSMVLDSSTSTIYIYAGQRNTSYLSELWSIKLASSSSITSVLPSTSSTSPDITITSSPSLDEESESDSDAPTHHWRSGTVVPSHPPTILSTTLILRNCSRSSSLATRDDGPLPGFTQRLAIDSESGEWTLLSGMVADKRGETPMGEVWRRSKEGRWEEVEVKGDRPEPRFAAQVVYDPLRKEHYLMGGNPKDPIQEDRRSGDLWRLKIIKPSPEEALRKAKFLVRKQRFTEMCQTQPTLSALNYLQTTLSSVVDHTDELEASAFRSCMASLLAAPSSNNYEESMDEDQDDEDDDESVAKELVGSDLKEVDKEIYEQRHKLFEDLMDFFPREETQPKDDLRDMATMRWGDLV